MAPRKPAVAPLSALFPRALRKHWPALRTPYLASLFVLSLLAVKLALFTSPASPPLPNSAHTSASAALVAPDLPTLTNLSHYQPLAHHFEQPPNERDDLAEAVEAVEAVEAEVRAVGGEKEHTADAPAQDVQRNVEAAPEQQAPAPPPPSTAVDRAAADSAPRCMKYIIYDKPVKTGSTAVRDALLSYFATRRAEFVACTFEECNAAAERILAGTEAKRNLVEHLLGQDGLVERLGEAGYYKATSIRAPRDRWESAFRYNRAKKARHYGIEADVSYDEFMQRMPPCSLYDFYDQQGGACGDNLEERIKKIVYRYHEIIDLYDEPAGQLHLRLVPFLAVSNKSPETNSDGDFDVSRLENETKLYNALKKRRLELHGHEPLLC